MLPDETADSCKVVSIQLEIWGLIPSPTSQQLLGAHEELALQSSCTVSVASPEGAASLLFLPLVKNTLWICVFICLLFRLLQEEAILY